MTTYAWPVAFVPERFEMRILPNTKVFVGPYTPTVQVLDYGGERWTMNFDLPLGIDSRRGAWQEAFFDRLKGPAHLISIWNLRRPVPQGTLNSGTPTLVGSVPQLSNTLTLQCSAGQTLLAGDHIGLPNGQNVRVMADAVANGTGQMVVEFQPRARSLIASGGSINLVKPTVNMMLKGDGVPISWGVGGMFDGCSIELVEAW